MSRYFCPLCLADADWFDCKTPAGMEVFANHVSEDDLIACVERFGPSRPERGDLVAKLRLVPAETPDPTTHKGGG